LKLQVQNQNMKKILLMIALIAGTASLSMAQRGGNREEWVQRNVDRLKTSLNLSAEQEVKVKAIITASEKSQDSIRATLEQGAGRETLMQKMRPLREANDKKIMAILNEEQKKAYTAILEERRQRGPGGPGGQNGEGRRRQDNTAPKQ
jgi:periplasmic protein CpxP/Spy